MKCTEDKSACTQRLWKAANGDANVQVEGERPSVSKGTFFHPPENFGDDFVVKLHGADAKEDLARKKITQAGHHCAGAYIFTGKLATPTRTTDCRQ